jgi:DNA invertase Pin-like site-specific DNA recombinase
MTQGKRFVAYYRVSSEKQGRSGLGLEAQQDAVRAYCTAHGGWPPVREFMEVESGKRNDRPELAKALAHCRMVGATLCIAKLDRLGRKLHFISGLMESGVEFVAADAPDKDRFMLHVRAAFAEEEGRKISQRTREALQAWKARNPDRRLGNPHAFGGAVYRAGGEAVRRLADERAEQYLPEAKAMRGDGMSLGAIAEAFTSRGYRTARGGQWSATHIKRLLDRA